MTHSVSLRQILRFAQNDKVSKTQNDKRSEAKRDKVNYIEITSS
jgi:hypothetical protein